jgi:hypothetical protein
MACRPAIELIVISENLLTSEQLGVYKSALYISSNNLEGSDLPDEKTYLRCFEDCIADIFLIGNRAPYPRKYNAVQLGESGSPQIIITV